jgi:hypothetical protein
VPGEVILAALDRVWTTLEPTGVSMAVMGGLGLSVWGHLRSTQDVDLLVALEGRNLEQTLELLYRADFRPKRRPPLVRVDQQEIVQLYYDPPDALCEVQVDLLLVAGRYQQTAIERRVPAKLPGLARPIAVLSREDMILHKLLAGRIIDRADAATLLRENRPLIDFDYLRQWITDLSLAGEFAVVWQEAFPDEKPPL